MSHINTQKGFISRIAIGIISVLILGAGTSGYFIAKEVNQNVPPVTKEDVDMPSEKQLQEDFDDIEPEIKETREESLEEDRVPVSPPNETKSPQKVDLSLPLETHSVSLPTSQEIEVLSWFCGTSPEACTEAVIKGFYENEAFRILTVDAIDRAKEVLGTQEGSQGSLQAICLSQETPEELRTLSPQQQKYLREQRCGTSTPESEVNYKLHQQQKYTECLYSDEPEYYCEIYKPIFY